MYCQRKVLSLLVLVASIISSTRAAEGQPLKSPPMRFGTATELPAPVNDSSRIDFSMDISQDGRELYYCSGSFNSIWVARRANVDDEFGEPEWVTSGCGPSLSSDGLNLFVAASGEFGGDDILQFRRASLDAAWGEPENMGKMINSELHEDTPNISPDGKTLYFTRGSSANTGFRIWQAKRNDVSQPFGEATQVAGVIANIDAYDVEVTEDNLKLFFSVGTGDIAVALRRSEDAEWEWGQSRFLSRKEVNSKYYEWSTSLSGDGRTLYFDRLVPGGELYEGEFNSSDLVDALADGGYEQGPRPPAVAVPEPFGLLPMSGMLLLIWMRARKAVVARNLNG